MGGIKPIKKMSVYLGEQLLPFFLPSPFLKPGLVPDFKSGKCWRILTPEIAKELNAQDRKTKKDARRWRLAKMLASS
jgi:hypothetical protein